MALLILSSYALQSSAMRPTTDQGRCTTLADEAQSNIGPPNLSATNDKTPSLLNENQMATIFVLSGASKGLEFQLTKPRTSIGQAGGGADIEIDDHQASVLHCVVTGTQGEDMVRLYDLDSASGTYVYGKCIQAASLENFSEFRIGTTDFIVTIVSKHSRETT
jgi:Inner membrane component of T3SS, cytoplasmic domain